MISINTNAAVIKTPDTAATRTSRVASIMPHMRIGRVSVRASTVRQAAQTFGYGFTAVVFAAVFGFQR